MRPSILRVVNGARKWWVITDGIRAVEGTGYQSRGDVVGRWEARGGRPAHGYIRIPGEVRPSELAAHIAELRRRAPKSCRVCGCTDDDCRQCVEATGHACSWVAGEDPPLCSRCAAEQQALRADNAAVARLRASVEGGAR